MIVELSAATPTAVESVLDPCPGLDRGALLFLPAHETKGRHKY